MEVTAVVEGVSTEAVAKVCPNCGVTLPRGAETVVDADGREHCDLCAND